MLRTLFACTGIMAVLMLLSGCSHNPPMKSVPVSAPPALAACPTVPRCVSSEASDPRQKMAAIAYQGSREHAQQQLRQILAGMSRTVVTVDLPGYVAAEVTSRLVRFVDDVEFLFDKQASLIHFRSSSRVGYYDFKVNRERMEAVIQEFRSLQSAQG